MIGCATCGAAPVGTYNDGSPRFPASCDHPPLVADAASTLVDPYGRVIVELDAFEMLAGQACGQKRFEQSRRRKLRDKLFTPDLAANEVGALGEAAFSKWIGRPFECTTGRFRGAPDVAGCQVKTRTRGTYELIVHEDDPGRTPVVLVVASPPRFWIRGWILARDAKRDEWRKNPDGRREAWFVPNLHLLPMSTFLGSNAVRAAMGLPPIGVTTDALSEAPHTEAATPTP